MNMQRTNSRFIGIIAIGLALLTPEFTHELAFAQTPSAQPIPAVEEELPPRQKVSLTTLLSLELDVRRVEGAKTHAEELLGEEPSSTIFEILDMVPIDRDSAPESAFPQFRMQIFTAYPVPATGFDLVFWGSKQQWEKEVNEAKSYVEISEGVYEAEGSQFTFSEHYGAMRTLEGNVYTDDTGTALRRLLQQTEQARSAKALSITSTPKALSRSAIKPFIDAQRATLATNAQQRDEEDSLMAIGRPLSYRMLNSMLSAVVDDTESFEYSFDYSLNDRRSTVELSFQTAKGSEFDRYIARLNQVRNRSLTYLHPDHTSFATIAVPLPELVTSVLPQLSIELFNGLELQAPDIVTFGQVVSQLVEANQAELMVQTIATSAESQLTIAILPLASASSLESTSVQLVSGLGDQTWQKNVGEVGGWPVHKGEIDETDFYFTLTDHCIAVMLGPEDSFGVLEKVVTRDFEESPDAARFARTAFAVQTSSVELSQIEWLSLPKRIMERLEDDGRSSLEDSIEFSIQTEPQKVSVRASFGPDALIAGTQVYEFGIEMLSELLNALE